MSIRRPERFPAAYRWLPARLAILFAGIGALAASAAAQLPVELETGDGVLLSGTFFPAEEAGVNTPIVVMLAGENESPAVFQGLATRLQTADEGESTAKPMSVLTIALRGLGDSTRVRGADGSVTDRRGAKLTPADAAAMVKSDMEAVRRFLVDKNDAGQLNLNRLGYLGVELGAIVATGSAAVDWSVPVLSRGKQGRDVKALVLVSPPWKQLGLDMLTTLRQPGVRSEIAFLITYGQEDKEVAGNVSRIVKQLEKGRPAPAKRASGEEVAALSVVDAPGNSPLQGSAWLKQAGPDGETAIIRFFDRTLAQPDYPWSQRRLK